MTTKLKEALRCISSEPKTDEELELGVRNLVGFIRRLLSMQQETIKNESDNINQSFNQNAGRRFEPVGTEQPTS